MFVNLPNRHSARSIGLLLALAGYLLNAQTAAGQPADPAKLEATLRQLEKDITAVRGLEFKFPVLAKVIPRPKDAALTRTLIVDLSIYRNEGTVSCTGIFNIQLGTRSNPSRLGQAVNTGSFINQSGISIVGIAGQLQAGEFRNELTGVMIKQAGVLATIESPYINFGAVSLAPVLGNALTFAGGLQQNGGSIQLNNGTLTVPSGFTMYGGDLYLGNSGLGTLAVPMGLTIASGARLAGVGVVDGNVVNAGIIQPGLYGDPPAGVPLFISGDFTQLAIGTLQFRLANGGMSDTLVVNATATLDGTLIESAQPGVNLGQGAAFNVVTAGTRVGNFSTRLLPDLAPGLQWEVVLTPTDLRLQVIQP